MVFTSQETHCIWIYTVKLVMQFTVKTVAKKNTMVGYSAVILLLEVMVKVKVSRYRPGVAQKVGRGIALLFHDRGTRKG